MEGKKSRREFLIQSSRAAAGLVAAGALASCASTNPVPAAKRRIIGANDRINMAVVGIRGRGGSHASSFARMKNVFVKTLVDVDENLFKGRADEVEKLQGSRPTTEWDLRRVLDDPEIDAITVATTNHWHALATIWACQAGKHVYVEKPCAHNVFEGRKMVEAARRYNCLVSVGCQNRSIRNVRQAMKFLHDGGIGDVYMAKGLCFKPRESLGKCPDGYGPGGTYEYLLHGRPGPVYDKAYMDKVHYEMWLGPAPKRPFNHNRFHYNWHWFWDYGNGDIGNQGPHQWDIARWGLNKNEHPVKIQSEGGYFAFDSDQETANTQTATLKYADGKVLQFEVRGLYTNDEDDVRIGNLFYGSKGWMHLNGSTWKTYMGRKNEPGPSNETAEEAADPMDLTGAGGGNHYENFIIALRSGKVENLTCDIEEGFRSTALPLLANIAYRLDRTLYFDGEKEKFKGDGEADSMLTRNYRDPYVVPDKV